MLAYIRYAIQFGCEWAFKITLTILKKFMGIIEG